MSWQLQDAKQKFSEFVRKAVHEGPQVVTRHGEEVAVLVSVETYNALTGKGKDFKEFLLSVPEGDEFGIERSGEPAPAIEL